MQEKLKFNFKSLKKKEVYQILITYIWVMEIKMIDSKFKDFKELLLSYKCNNLQEWKGRILP
jgi:hypothetical protein